MATQFRTTFSTGVWVCVILLAQAACSGTTETPTRSLTLLQSIGDGDQRGGDTLLVRPVAFAVVGRDTIAIADDAEKAVRVIDMRTRQIIRQFGRAGSGPGELQRIGGMARSPDGRIAVMDVGNRRLAMFSSGGELLTETPFSTPRPNEIAFDARSRLHWNRIVGDASNIRPIVVASTAGAEVRSYGRALRPLEPLDNGLLNMVRFAASSDGGMWVLHNYTGLVERFDSLGTMVHRFSIPLQPGQDTTGPIIHRRDAAGERVSIRRNPIAEDISVQADSTLWFSLLVPVTDSAPRSRILEFDTRGTLRSTTTLNTRANRIAVADSLLYTLRLLVSDPAQIDVYRITTRR
jgi:hypothetical protein